MQKSKTSARLAERRRAGDPLFALACRHPMHARSIGQGQVQHRAARLVDRPHVRTPGESERFWSAFEAVSSGLPVRGNLVPDAHLVALMRDSGVETIVSRDRDFRKFDGIRVRDPFG